MEESSDSKLIVHTRIDAPPMAPKRRAPIPRFSSWSPMSIEGLVAPDNEDVATIEWRNETPLELEQSILPEGAPSKLAGYEVLQALGSQDGFDFYLGARTRGVGIVHRVIIKQVPRGRRGYAFERGRLIQEARIGERFHHPNLVPLLDVHEDETGCCLLIEDLVGTNLQRATLSLRARGCALPLELIVWIVSEVLRGLAHAHGLKDKDGELLGLVLRDIVPANILITDTGQVKLATFALQIVPRPHCESRPLPDAAAYLAPERVARAPCGPAADIYAAGMLLFELLAGQTVLTNFAPPQILAKLMHEGLPMDALSEAGVPGPLISIVERATQRAPDERFAGALEMAAALEGWLEGSGLLASPSTLSRLFAEEGLYEQPHLLETVEESSTAQMVSLFESAERALAQMDAALAQEERTIEEIEWRARSQPVDLGPEFVKEQTFEDTEPEDHEVQTIDERAQAAHPQELDLELEPTPKPEQDVPLTRTRGPWIAAVALTLVMLALLFIALQS